MTLTGNLLLPKLKGNTLEGWQPVSFSEVEGWNEEDHQAAFACFRMSARALADDAPVSREAVEPSSSLLSIAALALKTGAGQVNDKVARKFFETNFQLLKYKSQSGFVTAYFEPEVPASRIQTKEFPYPLYRRPDDLVKIDKNNPPAGISKGIEYARRTQEGLVEFYDRGEIDNGALAGQDLELFWLRSEVEGFYIHVQGSARLLFEDGTSARVSYAGKTGHPYTSIAKLLVQRGVFTVETANMKNMREWLETDRNRALEVLHHNRSFIFFAEAKGQDPEFGPIAAAGVQLTPGRSLAVDKSIHAYGTPVWLRTTKPLPFDTKPFARLMIAQDTGSAILGPQRGDIFIGSGDEAGLVAGSVRHETEFMILAPKG